ncbi:MAG TPA: MerR family transcriptional regulator [Beijerinckiaceae bacterium]|jgi:DNA-binding transcriptional MerR regulator
MSPLAPREPARAVDKSPDAFRTISEVADDLDLPQHVLRFWETRFSQIKPLKRGGGRRYYRPDDVDLLKGIRHLLYGEGYTIKGVQRILKEDGIRFVQAIGRGEETIEAPPRGGGEPDEAGPGPGGTAPETAEAAGSLVRAESAPQAPSRPEAHARAAGATLGSQDAARLRAALDELLECERVLAALKTPPLQDDELPPR